MKKIKYFTILLLVLTIITGCKSKDEKKINKAVNETAISQKKIKSYRAKVSIRTDELNLNYIVYNTNNKTYSITFMEEDKQINLEIDKKGKITSDDSSYQLKYDLKDTDSFLKELDLDDKTLKSSTMKIGEEEYTKYEFSVTKESLNNMLKPFNVKAKKAGEGYALVDKDNHVYIVNYSSDNININVSYTRLES